MSMWEELFGKIVDLPVRYLDTHSHGDVMSRMTNDIENISDTVSSALPSLFSGVLTVLATKFLSKRVRRFSRKRQQLLHKWINFGSIAWKTTFVDRIMLRKA